MTLTPEIRHDQWTVTDADGGTWWPDEDAREEIDADLVLCVSPDGWSLHAPGSTDEDIATGDAPCLVSGPGEPTDADYGAARGVLAVRICDATPMRGSWRS